MANLVTIALPSKEGCHSAIVHQTVGSELAKKQSVPRTPEGSDLCDAKQDDREGEFIWYNMEY